MSSPIVAVTAQAAMFSALSSVLAHIITMWQHQASPWDISANYDPGFMIIAMITTPPNYLYQRFMEDKFPSKTTVIDTKKDDDKARVSEQLSVPNTAAKFFLDQSISAACNTILFIFLIGILKGKSLPLIQMDIQNEFWSMITAGWRFWPIVTLLNLVVVPFEYRMLVGSTAGVLWGVYVTLRST